jgi:hypothetical protein
VPFDPHEFLTLAEQLLTGTATEGAVRTAASRAYYALHLKARQNLAAAKLMTPTHTGEDHMLVITTLRSRGGPEGDIIDSLRRLRIRSDYRIDQAITATETGRAVSLAASVYPRL